MNDGHEINTAPDATVPSARYRVPLIVVSAGPCAWKLVENVNTISTISTSESNTSAAIGKHL